MKKLLAFILIIVSLMSLASCGQFGNRNGADRDGVESVKTYNDTEWLNDVHVIDEPEMLNFNVQYIREGAKKEPTVYPAVRVIHSVDEMNRYLQNETYMSENLVEACNKYDENYFKSQLLIIVLLEEGSGSIRHEVEQVGIDAGKTIVDIKTIVPEVGTCDMAYWHVLIEPEAGVDVASEEDVIVFLDGRNTSEKHTVASHSKGFANISVTLKHGWEYDIVDEADTNEFAINIYPTGQSQNKIRIAYFNGFGVCGTGLKQEQIMLGKYEAWMGTYDNNTVWDFISLRGLPGDYAILNEGGDKWWKEYGDDAMQILATLKVADGYVTSSDAIKIARDKLQTDYDEVTTTYSPKDGIWTVTLTKVSGDDREVMKVTVDIYGNISDMTTDEQLLHPDNYDEFLTDIYLCDDVYRSDSTPPHGTGSIQLPMGQDCLELKNYGILLCGDGCAPESVVSRASQGYAPAYQVVSDGEKDGNFKVLKFKMVIPEPMLEDIKDQGVYEQITEQIESQYYYLLVLDENHYAYIHLERIKGATKIADEAELADSIVKSARIHFEPAGEKLNLTIERVIRLAENKGEKLTWDDFKMYNAIETGSGLYILVYEIDETFDLWIGGGAPVSSPMYIRLVTKDNIDNYIDIRTGDVEKFISENRRPASSVDASASNTFDNQIY